MKGFGKAVVRLRFPILIAALLLLIPAYFSMISTRINYDMLTYLPKDMETVKGQDILMDEFGKGAFSFVVVEGLPDKDVAALREKIEAVDHVDSALWYDSLADLSIPKEFLPDRIRDVFVNGDATMIAVFFDTASSADETLAAVETIRSVTGTQCFVSGITALVVDLRNLCEREEPIYVGIAVLCALIAMMLLTDSWLVPLVFLAGIGMTILYNLGTNFLFGEISYITKALAAVLQLAVTMDYSIFLWHSYSNFKKTCTDRKEAMANAITETIGSVSGSSLTTIAGFLALCFMTYMMGMDLGLVMAKGCIFGVIGSVTILPSLILLFDKPLAKASHRPLIPDMTKPANWIIKHFKVFLILFVIVLIPAVIGYTHAPVYYDFTKILSGGNGGGSLEDMPFLEAKEKLNENFDVATTHMILCDADMPSADMHSMMNRIEELPGVSALLGIGTVSDTMIPSEFIPENLTKTLKSGDYQLLLVNSSYAVSSDEVNNQIDAINAIIDDYDKDGMLIGEAPATKDLIEITDTDFNVVSWISIAFVFIIILFALRSVTLPVILVVVIEFAVFINLGIPYFTGYTMPFIAPICISTIQLGSTVDYAILMTTRYKQSRKSMQKKEAVTDALRYAMPSVLVSALSFFAATIGVGIYSDIDLISSMCVLLARGALISMASVLFVLPSLLVLLDGVVMKTTLGIRPRNKKTKAHSSNHETIEEMR